MIIIYFPIVYGEFHLILMFSHEKCSLLLKMKCSHVHSHSSCCLSKNSEHVITCQTLLQVLKCSMPFEHHLDPLLKVPFCLHFTHEEIQPQRGRYFPQVTKQKSRDSDPRRQTPDSCLDATQQDIHSVKFLIFTLYTVQLHFSSFLL